MKLMRMLCMAAVAAILTLCACSSPEKPLSQLVIGQPSTTERLSPVTMSNPESFFVAWQIYQGLLGLDEKGNLLPVIAESWESQDSRIWTFHIRKGVRFHESELFKGKSREVTAHDVYYAYTRFCSSKAYPSFMISDSIKGCAAFNSGDTEKVEGLKVIDDYTFQIELNQPEPFFLNRISNPWLAIFPKESEDKAFEDSWGLKIAVGTGPYRLESKTENEIILKKNDDYWDKSHMPAVDTLIFRVIKNDQIRFSELTNGKIDLMALPSQMFPTVFDSNGTPKDEYKEKFRFKPTETFNTHLLGINTKAVSDVHLRRAMYYGTNRDELVQQILFGYGDVLGGAVPPGMNGYVSPYKELFNPALAREELKKSSYDGSDIQLLIHDLANSELIGQIFQKQMKDIGVNIKLEQVDFNSAIGRMIKGDAQMFSMFAEVAFSSPEPLLINLFSSQKIPVPNFWKFSDPEIDLRMENLRKIDDRAESVKQSEAIDKDIMDKAPAIFLYRQKQVIMFSKAFDNLVVNGHNHFKLNRLTKSE